MVDPIIYECTDVLSHQPLTALVGAELWVKSTLATHHVRDGYFQSADYMPSDKAKA